MIKKQNKKTRLEKTGVVMSQEFKIYKILKDGEITESKTPGRYAGWRPGKIFGRLDCASGKQMKKENRVFFHTWEEAVAQGYRPCKNCRPTPDNN